MEWILPLVVSVLGFGLFAHRADRAQRIAATVVLILLCGAVWWQMSAPPKAGSPDDPASATRPLESREGGFVSSDACRSCHPAEYASWEHSYHRSMTQVVTPETMLATWDGTELETHGRTYRLEQEGDQYWIDMLDPQFTPTRRYRGRLLASENTTERVRRRVVQSTGSHHQQIFWYAGGLGRELYLLPFTWLVDDARWVPYGDTVMWKPDEQYTTDQWGRVCIKCHSTAGQPRPVASSLGLDTHVAELGIACESCHGPAEAHVEAYQNPLRRYFQYGSDEAATEIVNPAKLGALGSSQVCGQCHSHTKPKGRAEWKRFRTTGHSYRPGDDLDATRRLHKRPPDSPSMNDLKRRSVDSITWPDGIFRAAGRDYHGVLETPCFAGGEYSCLSCHSMHDYEDRDDQLKAGMRTNTACLQCHPEFEEPNAVEAHTHHRAESAGSLCYGCHMPHTSYALLKGVRSHTLTSPNVRESVEHGRPNACNLCHLDQTLEWTRATLGEWYGQEATWPEGHVVSERSAAVDWLLEGDAAQRGLIAWAMSRSEAHEASGSEWIPPLLARVLNDDEYPAVSEIAQRTLARLPGYEDFSFTDEDVRARVIERWASLPTGETLGVNVYQQRPGVLDTEAIDAAYARRDRRDVLISE